MREPEWTEPYRRALEALDSNKTAQALEFFTAVNTLRGPRGDGPSRFFIERLKSGDPLIDGVVEIREK